MLSSTHLELRISKHFFTSALENSCVEEFRKVHKKQECFCDGLFSGKIATLVRISSWTWAIFSQ